MAAHFHGPLANETSTSMCGGVVNWGFTGFATSKSMLETGFAGRPNADKSRSMLGLEFPFDTQVIKGIATICRNCRFRGPCGRRMAVNECIGDFSLIDQTVAGSFPKGRLSFLPN